MIQESLPEITLEKLTPGSHLIRTSQLIGTFQGIETKNSREYLVVQFPNYKSFIPTEQYGKLCYPISEVKVKEMLLSQPLKTSEEAKKIQLIIDYIRKYQKYSIANFKDYVIPPELCEQLKKLLAKSKREDFVFTGSFHYPDRLNEIWVTANLDHALSYLTPLSALPIWDRNRRRALYFVDLRNPKDIIQYIHEDYFKENQLAIPNIPTEHIYATVLLTGIRDSANIMDIIFHNH
ncbi:MAG: hypothetical protein Q7R97_02880 [Candidatus Daviesbacteria bacterium]|nr:hypothetical protein [Candidatus Daviesbacteria bacterium]